MRLEFKDLTYILFGISFVPGAKRGLDMVYMKYLLGKTGLFPRCEPQAYDVLKAAFRAYEIRKTVNARGKKYFCVVPTTYNRKEVYDMVRVFRANGVFLMPRKSKEKNRSGIVFWVRDRGQRFMQDAYIVNQNADNFQQVLAHYTQKKQTTLQKLFGKFENEK